MKPIPERVLSALKGASHPLGVQEILRASGLHPGTQTEVKQILRVLVREGRVDREGKRFLLPPSQVAGSRPDRSGARRFSERPARGRPAALDTAEGRLVVHRDGFGFVDIGEEKDVFLPEHEARKALDNDRVRIERVRERGRVEGRIVEVLERTRAEAVGVYLETPGGRAKVVPRDASLRGPIRVPPTQIARNGDVVRVRLGVGRALLGGDSTDSRLVGEVSGSLGRPGAPSQEVLSIAFGQGFSDRFPPEVMDEADALPAEVAETPGRRDLRALPLVTIDGADARDFDDAVYAERIGNGFRLWVAIADVSHYVRKGSALDQEAFARGTSVYLPGRVLPMLPERLSNGLCSLRPDEDRLCLVAQVDFDRKGKRGAYEIYPAIMRSAARCTYEEVQAVLDGQGAPNRVKLEPRFRALAELATALRKMREARGAIDFDLPEVRPEVDDAGRPVRMVQRERLFAHRLIEECMLAANEAVAHFFHHGGLPTVYRFHGEPDEKKIAAFLAQAQVFGFRLGQRGEITSKELNAFVQELAGHPEQRALEQLLLRSMMQAVYSSEEMGHYGLAAEHYLHFTSPIRRYPDLIVHRLLKAHWAHPERKRKVDGGLEPLAKRSSERERAAMKVERETVSFYAALLMKDRIGERFEGTVSAITDFGAFVLLDSEHVEGLVKLESMGEGGRYDPEHLSIVFPQGFRLKVGSAVQVRLVSVDVDRRQIDFELAKGTQAERTPTGHPRGTRVEKRPSKAPARKPARKAASTSGKKRAQAPRSRRQSSTRKPRPSR